MPDFSDFASSALASIKELVTNEFKDHSQEALKDAQDFLDSSRKDLARWLELQAEGQLTADDLAWLIKGKKDAVRLLALKRAGVALARLERFQTALVGIAINTASAGLGQLAGMATTATGAQPGTRSRSAAPKKKSAKAGKTATPKKKAARKKI